MRPEPPDLLAFGRAVRAIRNEKNISQNHLAESTGFTQGWISDTENGKRNPSWTNIGRLARGLGVSVSELAARAETLSRSKPGN
jgi:transcriptional regulator with XRE-family HTH domain